MAREDQIICPSCKAKLKFNPEKISADTVKCICPGCKRILRLKKTASGYNLSPPQTTKDSNPQFRKFPDDQETVLQQPTRGNPLHQEYKNQKGVDFGQKKAEPGNNEWLLYADDMKIKPAEYRINLDDLPASVPSLKETLADLHQAEKYNHQGEKHLDRNLYRQALRDFNHALKINPDYLEALINRGSTYILLDKLDEALEDFNHALKMDIYNEIIFNARGEIHLANKMYEEAIKDFTSAIILNPVFTDAYLNRGRAYSEKNMKDEAAADFNQAVRADYHQLPDINFLDSSITGLEQEDYRNSRLAAKSIQLGLKYLKAGKYNEAAAAFSQAVDLRSNESKGFFYRGLAYMKLARYDEAMADFDRAIHLDPLDAKIYYQRGRAEKALDRSSKSMLADFKLSCELGYEPGCAAYKKLKA